MSVTYKTLNTLQRDFRNLLYLQVQFFLIVIIISFGCNSGKSAYRNESEKKYMNRSSATIWHEKKAIKHQSKNGVYTVSFNYRSGGRRLHMGYEHSNNECDHSSKEGNENDES